jgi:hypothetical protein
MPITNIPRATSRVADTAPTSATAPVATSSTTAPAEVSSRAELHGTHFAGSVDGARPRQGGSSSPARAGGASAEGFGLLASLGRATGKQLAAAAFGFALLMPPIVGQVMHPGASPSTAVKSPIAMQLQQKSDVTSGASVRGQLQGAVSKVPGGVGAAREDAIRNVIGVVDRAQLQTQKAHALLSDASRAMESLKRDVCADARMGFVVDLYWFGVPDAHHVYHEGRSDLSQTQAFVSDLDAAATMARAAARNEVSKLLTDESPAFAQLKTTHAHVGHQLDVAKQIEGLANRAGDKLESTAHYITLRNITPQTVTVDDYETRVTKNADGTSSSERVRVGSHEEENPSWRSYSNLALVAKADAEGAIRELNGVIKASRGLFPSTELGRADAKLISVFDFIGQPSFGVWSYDSFSVQDAKRHVQQLEVAGARLVGNIQPEFNRLDTDMNRQITARYDVIAASAVTPRS